VDVDITDVGGSSGNHAVDVANLMLNKFGVS
jgi:hypothetical protein